LQLSQLPLSCGIGGFLLARAAAEMLCEALAACWSAGSAAPVRRLMLLPQGIISAKPERMVSTEHLTAVVWMLLIQSHGSVHVGSCTKLGSAAPVRRRMLLPQGIISAQPEQMVSTEQLTAMEACMWTAASS
jgi:hypothetical protein